MDHKSLIGGFCGLGSRWVSFASRLFNVQEKEASDAHFCRFGERIDVDGYTRELFAEGVDPEEAAKSMVKKLNAEIEERLIGLTVNAPDWCVMCTFRCPATEDCIGRHSTLLRPP